MEKIHLAEQKKREAEAKKQKKAKDDAKEAEEAKAKPAQKPMSKLDRVIAAENAKKEQKLVRPPRGRGTHPPHPLPRTRLSTLGAPPRLAEASGA